MSVYMSVFFDIGICFGIKFSLFKEQNTEGLVSPLLINTVVLYDGVKCVLFVVTKYV